MKEIRLQYVGAMNVASISLGASTILLSSSWVAGFLVTIGVTAFIHAIEGAYTRSLIEFMKLKAENNHGP